MNFPACGDRVRLKWGAPMTGYFDSQSVVGVVVGFATLQSGVPCVLISTDESAPGVPRAFTERMLIPTHFVEKF